MKIIRSELNIQIYKHTFLRNLEINFRFVLDVIICHVSILTKYHQVSVIVNILTNVTKIILDTFKMKLISSQSLTDEILRENFV